jgi:hypothetical protein
MYINSSFFYYSSLHWPMFTFGGKILLPFMIKLIGILKTYKLKLLKLLKLLEQFLYITIVLLSLFLHVHSYTRVITHVERLSDGLLILRYLNY